MKDKIEFEEGTLTSAQVRAWASEVESQQLKDLLLQSMYALQAEESRLREENEHGPSAYWGYVRSIAQEIFDRDPGSDDAGANEYEEISQAVDGSCWIIYCTNGQRVMNLADARGYTSNPDAWEQVGSECIMAKDGAEAPTLETMITRMAYFAMEADVADELRDLRSNYEEEEEEEEEEESAPSTVSKED